VIWIRIEGVVAVKVEVGLVAAQVKSSNVGEQNLFNYLDF